MLVHLRNGPGALTYAWINHCYCDVNQSYYKLRDIYTHK